MATWIVHLRLAENLLKRIDGLDPAYFAMGSVAPDSGIPDENWENFDPPPEILHFKTSHNEDRQLADLEFYRQQIKPQTQQSVDPKRFAFLLGYFFHLVTDNLWNEQIGRPTQERFAKEFEDDPKFIWQVKRDWYGLDLEHVRNHPESIYWRVFLDCDYQQDYLHFLPKEALQQRLAYIKELYQRTDDRIEEWYGNRPDKYLCEQEMEDFIQTTTDRLFQIYAHIWIMKAEVPEIPSSLDFNFEN